MDDKIYEGVAEAVGAMLADAVGWLGRAVTFETLGVDAGVAFFASGGARTVSETRDITGGAVLQQAFPFRLVWRAASTSESQRLAVSDALERIGAWLCGEQVEIGGEVRLPAAYPAIGCGRILRVSRECQYANESYSNGVQDRVLPFTVIIEKDF